MQTKNSAIPRSRVIVIAVVSAALALIVGFLIGQTNATPSDQKAASQTSLSPIPPVRGFYNGQELLFIHTEASDQQVASMLSGMMGSTVLYVPSLSQTNLSSLGNVYVFKNGVKDGGPFGFQSDVFSSIPGDKDYTPLRVVNLVSWNQGATPRELRSANEIKAAQVDGELTIVRTNIVVNMPIVRWPGGQR